MLSNDTNKIKITIKPRPKITKAELLIKKMFWLSKDTDKIETHLKLALHFLFRTNFKNFYIFYKDANRVLEIVLKAKLNLIIFLN